MINTTLPVHYRFITNPTTIGRQRPNDAVFTDLLSIDAGLGGSSEDWYSLNPAHLNDNLSLFWIAGKSYHTYAPSEMGYPLSRGSNYIDLSIPMNTMYNYLPTSAPQPIYPENLATFMPEFLDCIGHLLIQTEFGLTTQDFAIYQSAGDDFRYGIFRPPEKCEYNPVAYNTPAIGIVTAKVSTYPVDVNGLSFPPN